MILDKWKGYWCTGKRGGNRGNHNYSQINVSVVPMGNYIFLYQLKERCDVFTDYIVYITCSHISGVNVKSWSPILIIFINVSIPVHAVVDTREIFSLLTGGKCAVSVVMKTTQLLRPESLVNTNSRLFGC